MPSTTEPARRHASRGKIHNGRLVDVYIAGPTDRPEVQLLGLRPAGTSATTHRANKCECEPVATEPESEWNSTCPRPDGPRWRVMYRDR
jgi:hypothetical protein